MNVKKNFLHSTDALSSSSYLVCVWSSLYITALFNVVCARHRNGYNYFNTAQKIVPECITMKETGKRGRKRLKKHSF